MSVSYSIFAMLDAEKDRESIEKILEKGHRQGWIYYKFILGKWNVDSEPLTLKEAVDAILEDIEHGLHCLDVQIKDTYATFFFVKKGYSRLALMIGSLSPVWSRKFNDEEEIDIPRYTKAFLDLIDDFQILELQVEKD